ncbi:hypothetical protein GCM10025864_42710 [Luteimicrobium album]|uniref:Secreted protein n=1 Tax=Luteimicrobium album TaxID=1054550 RepID=A0ABQ6I7X1_9MICO|nr:hypothetical protein GCM10025864_42710 [Luteimicrobium album]
MLCAVVAGLAGAGARNERRRMEAGAQHTPSPADQTHERGTTYAPTGSSDRSRCEMTVVTPSPRIVTP